MPPQAALSGPETPHEKRAARGRKTLSETRCSRLLYRQPLSSLLFFREVVRRLGPVRRASWSLSRSRTAPTSVRRESPWRRSRRLGRALEEPGRRSEDIAGSGRRIFAKRQGQDTCEPAASASYGLGQRTLSLGGRSIVGEWTSASESTLPRISTGAERKTRSLAGSRRALSGDNASERCRRQDAPPTKRGRRAGPPSNDAWSVDHSIARTARRGSARGVAPQHVASPDPR